jgi:hypothetical protein
LVVEDTEATIMNPLLEELDIDDDTATASELVPMSGVRSRPRTSTALLPPSEVVRGDVEWTDWAELIASVPKAPLLPAIEYVASRDQNAANIESVVVPALEAAQRETVRAGKKNR